MAHEVDRIGYPVDPHLRKLEFHLCDLAAKWGAAVGNNEKRERLAGEYHKTMEQLYSLGWESVLDIHCELPDELMPEEYLRRASSK